MRQTRPVVVYLRMQDDTHPTLVALDMSNSRDASGENSGQDVKRSSELLKVVVIG